MVAIITPYCVHKTLSATIRLSTMKQTIRDVVLYTTMVAYAGSLLLPGLVLTHVEGQSMVQYGYQILIVGSLGIFTGIFSWYGYMFGAAAFVALKARQSGIALLCALFGFMMALQALYLQKINARINFLDSYNNWENGMGVLGTGYYVWLFAFAFLLVQCIVAYLSSLRVADVNASNKGVTKTSGNLK